MRVLGELLIRNPINTVHRFVYKLVCKISCLQSSDELFTKSISEAAYGFPIDVSLYAVPKLIIKIITLVMYDLLI